MRAPAQTGRAIAYEVLDRVDRGGAYAGPALSAALNRAGGKIDVRERGLATELCYGVLRWTLALDAALCEHSRQPLEELEPALLTLLRLGAYQLIFLRIPDHAAVAETVNLAKAVGLGRAAGYLNAVLRKVAGTSLEALAPPATVDLGAHLRITAGLPEWITETWSGAFPQERLTEELSALALAINVAAPLSLRAPDASRREQALAAFTEAGLAAEACPRSAVGLRVRGAGAPEGLPSFEALGLASQDEAAQLVGDFARAPGPESLRIKRFFDPCGAPGGKSLHLLQALPEARGVATDLHKSRTRRIREEAARLGLLDRLQIESADARRPLPFLEAGDPGFDLVLIDAPCSGFGTLRRHPEIKLRRGPEDVARLAALQLELYEACLPALKPGGRLVIALCTYTVQEVQTLDDFAAAHPELQPEAVVMPEQLASTGLAGLVDLVDAEGRFQTWTHRDAMDGFYARRFRLNQP